MCGVATATVWRSPRAASASSTTPRAELSTYGTARQSSREMPKRAYLRYCSSVTFSIQSTGEPFSFS
jgi:hypothetical protein